MSQRGGPSAWGKPLGNSNAKATVPPHLHGGAGPASSSSASKNTSQLNPRSENFSPRGANVQPNHRAGQSVRSDQTNSAMRFPCPFPDCDESFTTNALLIKHKANPNSGHDYCKLCDLDFEDDDAYHIHKMSSDKHITCHICSEDFRSEAGCKRHMSQVGSALPCRYAYLTEIRCMLPNKTSSAGDVPNSSFKERL